MSSSSILNAFRIDLASWQDAETDLRILRELVFIHEQNVPPKLEWDGKDEACVHLLARDEKGRAIGTARMTHDGHIGRMAVLRTWRRRGIGSAMLSALITIARARQLPRVRLDAQTHAVNFYRCHNFVPQDKTFLDAGILHQHMTRQLPSLDEYLNLHNLQNQVLGKTRGILNLKNRDDNHAAAVHMVAQGQRSLHLFSPNLDPRLYNTTEFIDAVKQLALVGPRSKVYILIHDPGEVVMYGHRIVELARRISSHIFIHRADEEEQNRIDSFMIVDEAGLIRRPRNGRFEGSAEFNNPGEARHHFKAFNEAWERSWPEPELRRLHI
jgi:predicted GNAT family N-acyltransferase